MIMVSCLGAFNASAQTSSLKSPDGNIAFQWQFNEGNIFFDVTKDGELVIEKSPVVFSIDGKTLTDDCHASTPRFYNIDETYATRGAHSKAVNRANGMTLAVKELQVMSSPSTQELTMTVSLSAFSLPENQEQKECLTKRPPLSSLKEARYGTTICMPITKACT